MGRLPLEGVRIIDLCVVWAGPFGTLQLADLGAEVIRAESIQYTYVQQRGNPFPPKSSPQREAAKAIIGHSYPDREFGERPWNRFALFNWNARNKLSMTVDLTRPEGREIFKRLVKVSDGVVENQAVRVMENLGLGYDTLSEWNPHIIMVRMPGYGTSGPYKYRVAFGSTLESIAGHTELRRYPDLPPDVVTPIYHGDSCAGAALAGSFLQALLYRNRTGEGQLIDLSQAENVINTFAPAFMDYFMNGQVQQPIGNRDPSMAPQGCYPCDGDDKWCAVSIETDEQWKALCNVIDRPDLADDPRFADVLSRHRNHDEIDGYILAWTLFRDQYEVMNKLQSAGIPAGPTIDLPDVFRDPHLEARGHMVTINHPECGTHRYTGPLYRLSETPCRVAPAPLLGQHNMYVYKEVLGYSDDEIEHFIEEKHIGDAYLPGAR